jgi:hypothetical protein
VAVIALMVASRRASLTMYARVLTVAGLGYFALLGTTGTDVFQDRVNEMVEGHTADGLRRQLVEESLKVALENPVLGIAPQYLPFELSKRCGWTSETLDAHNVIGGVAGGTGYVGLILLFAAGATLWRWKRKETGRPQVEEVAWLIHMLLVLWIVRGQFTRDVLFSPSFAVALGLAIGLGMLVPQGRVRAHN